MEISERLNEKRFAESVFRWSSAYDRQIWNMAAPMLLASLIVPINNAIDTAVVGHLGTAAFSGVALSTTITQIISSCFSFPFVLIASTVAERIAAGRTDEVSRHVAHNMWFCLLMGLTLGGLLFAQAETILQLFKATTEIRPYAMTYLKTIALQLPAQFCIGCCGGTLRGLKENNTILMVTIVATIVNVALDYLLVFGCGWSVAGAGLATVVSMYVALALCLRKVIVRGCLRVTDILRIPNPLNFVSICRDGFSLSMKRVLFMAMLSAASAFIAQRSAVEHATFAICRLLTVVQGVVYFSLNQTVQILGASCIGKNDLKFARGMIFRAIQIAFVTTACIAAVFTGFAKQLAMILSKDPAVINCFAKVAPWIMPLAPIVAIVSVIDGAVVGASKSKISASAQALAYSIAIVAMIYFRHAGQLDVLRTWILIQFGTLLSGVVTGPYLFTNRLSPYGFKAVL